MLPEEVIKYPKIQSLYKRDDRGCFINEYTMEEFSYLYNLYWRGTEKIHGSNHRLVWNSNEDIVQVFGRTEKSQIPAFLYERLQSIANQIHPKMKDVFGEEATVVLFGEGYGSNIQDVGSRYISNGHDFILFDVWINGVWLLRSAVEEIGNRLGLKVVPVVFTGTLAQAEEYVKHGFKSIISEDKELEAEGLVLEPVVRLYTHRKRRIITKLKTTDYRKE